MGTSTVAAAFPEPCEEAHGWHWTIVEVVFDFISALCGWRFYVCFLAGIVLAFPVAERITATPLNLIVAGACVLAGWVIGRRWEDASQL